MFSEIKPGTGTRPVSCSETIYHRKGFGLDLTVVQKQERKKYTENVKPMAGWATSLECA